MGHGLQDHTQLVIGLDVIQPKHPGGVLGAVIGPGAGLQLLDQLRGEGGVQHVRRT